MWVRWDGMDGWLSEVIGLLRAPSVLNAYCSPIRISQEKISLSCSSLLKKCISCQFSRSHLSGAKKCLKCFKETSICIQRQPSIQCFGSNFVGGRSYCNTKLVYKDNLTFDAKFKFHFLPTHTSTRFS